jgi:hypothetical protein
VRGLGVALAAVVANLALNVAPAWAAPTYYNGPNQSHEYYDTDIRGLRWQIDYTYAAGKDESCAPGTTGDGWVCVAYVPNTIKYSGAVNQTSSFYYPYSMDVTLYRGSTITPSAGTYLELIALTCSAVGDWCSVPDARDSLAYSRDAPAHTYYDTVGGYFSARAIYQYQWRLPGCGGCWAYSSGTSGNVGLADGVALNASGGNYGLYLPPIRTAFPHLPPVISLGAPAGSTVHRNGPADVRQTLAMSVTSPHGNNWTGSVSLSCPGLPTVTDRLWDLKYRSGQQTVSGPITLPHQNGICTETGNATDTSGTGTAAARAVSNTFTYIWNTAPGAPTPNSPTANQNFAPGEPIPFSVTANDGETDEYFADVTVINTATNAVAATVRLAQTASGSPAVGDLLGLPDGTYSYTAIPTDQWGAAGARSTPQAFTVGGSVVPVGNLGGGLVEGTVHFTNSGGIPASPGCANTTFTVNGASAAFVLNTAGSQYAGPVSISGAGASGPACESASGGSGTLTLSASGAINDSQLSCPTLAGTYTRNATDVTATLSGACTINALAAGNVTFSARVQFAPTDPGGGVTTAITNAAFGGVFVVSPN